MNKLKNNSQNQLRQVVLLLAIAVILPTVCLLWFMTQAVKNERLAVRQKLIDSYTARGQEIFYESAYAFLNDPNNFSSTIAYREQRLNSLAETFQQAEKLEFIDANYAGALKEYEKAKFLSNPDTVYYGMLGQARSLLKLNQIDEAINICRQCVNEKNFSDEQKAKARLLLINLYKKTNNQDLLKELQNQLSVNLSFRAEPRNLSKSSFPIPTETQIFILDELIRIAKESGLAQNLQAEINATQKFIESANLTIAAIDFLNKGKFSTEPNKSFFKIAATPLMYCIYLKTSDKKTLALVTEEKMSQLWQKSVDDFTDELVFCKIYDETGKQIAGGKVAASENFAMLNLKNCFAGWKVELYLRAGVFKEAADKKMVVYMWVAGVVISLMLASTFLAGSAVLRQAKLNKLKNDFIATITHELKTPLASMRILVDTLLDEKCQSRQQEIEYLQLISKENARLSRLIDNFLTFSRMERNKQAFDFAPANPAEIAKAAADAVQTKFSSANCKFTVTINDNLPPIMADKDAIITVLVNLLDNAFKYSGENKEIAFNAFADNQSVCFSVKDNGIGLTRRQIKKVFDKFYQVDSSLSRKVEGTGLGLSIVKFIVDAHKGKINVESKLGKGSIFTVKINH